MLRPTWPSSFFLHIFGIYKLSILTQAIPENNLCGMQIISTNLESAVDLIRSSIEPCCHYLCYARTMTSDE
jgi:hypothetical protein